MLCLEELWHKSPPGSTAATPARCIQSSRDSLSIWTPACQLPAELNQVSIPGWGQVLEKRRLVPWEAPWCRRREGHHSFWAETANWSIYVQVKDTRDHLGRGRFNGYSFRWHQILPILQNIGHLWTAYPISWTSFIGSFCSLVLCLFLSATGKTQFTSPRMAPSAAVLKQSPSKAFSPPPKCTSWSISFTIWDPLLMEGCMAMCPLLPKKKTLSWRRRSGWRLPWCRSGSTLSWWRHQVICTSTTCPLLIIKTVHLPWCAFNTMLSAAFILHSLGHPPTFLRFWCS